jgi:hypothetical protein
VAVDTAVLPYYKGLLDIGLGGAPPCFGSDAGNGLLVSIEPGGGSRSVWVVSELESIILALKKACLPCWVAWSGVPLRLRFNAGTMVSTGGE